MPSIQKRIQSITDKQLCERLTERLEIIQHKIKFMQSMSVCVLDSFGNPNIELANYLMYAGGLFTPQPENAVYLLFYEKNKTLENLMRSIPALLNTSWQSVQYNNVCLITDNYDFNKISETIHFIEDLAEMLHPGHFIFGFEGDKWIKFTT